MKPKHALIGTLLLFFTFSAFAQYNPLNQTPDSQGKRKYQGYTYRLGSKGNFVKKSPAITPINGKIVLLSIGASTPDQIAVEFDRLVGGGQTLDVIVGNVWAQDINKWIDADNLVWEHVDEVLAMEGYTYSDIQIIWTMQDDLRDNASGFPGNPQRLYNKMVVLFDILHEKFPNLKTVEISGRPCGYSLEEKHSPQQTWYAGWSASWLVQDYRDGDLMLPFRISDGCYFWTDGNIVRQDGYYQIRSFYRLDGIHLEQDGIIYNGLFLYRYFMANHAYLNLPKL